MQQIYLTRRNLLTLLSKLDRVKKGEQSTCTLVKNDTVHPKYPCTSPTVILALEDEAYYTDRSPGAVHPADDPKRKRNK